MFKNCVFKSICKYEEVAESCGRQGSKDSGSGCHCRDRHGGSAWPGGLEVCSICVGAGRSNQHTDVNCRYSWKQV